MKQLPNTFAHNWIYIYFTISHTLDHQISFWDLSRVLFSGTASRVPRRTAARPASASAPDSPSASSAASRAVPRAAGSATAPEPPGTHHPLQIKGQLSQRSAGGRRVLTEKRAQGESLSVHRLRRVRNFGKYLDTPKSVPTRLQLAPSSCLCTLTFDPAESQE